MGVKGDWRRAVNGPKRTKQSEGREPTKRNAWRDRWYATNKERLRLASREWRTKNKKRALDYALAQYGIDSDDYQQLLDRQDNVCGICGLPPSMADKRNQRLVVDHDHHTGAVRGLLCQRCNRLLGQAKDSLMLLCAAVKYLRQYHVRD